MKYEIVEDASPFYIRFKFNELQDIIRFARSKIRSLKKREGFHHLYSHLDYPEDIGSEIISMLPMSKDFSFISKRVSVFDTPPLGGCGIHKDGADHRVSFNIPLIVLDSECKTFWYDDKNFDSVEMFKDNSYTRNVYKDFNTMNKFEHLKSMTALPDEMLLFNTEIYHSWINLSKTNSRKVITLRVVNPGKMYFDDAKKILFPEL